MALTPKQLQALNRAYRPFGAFDAWIHIGLPDDVWERYRGRLLAMRSQLGDDERSEATQRSLRASALNTGAIEGLHHADRGLTVTIATHAAGWPAVVAQVEGERAAALAEAALEAYDLALDLASSSYPITEAWIRRVHEVLAAPQGTYTVHTEVGPQEHALPLGEYKRHPNHVVSPDESLYAYAPVNDTAAEMQRLIEELRSDRFLASHPVLQAAYAHHAFTTVHPFADGNGRVARVLASVYLLRAASIPFFVFEDQKHEYFDALAAADRGDRERFVLFAFDRAVDTLGLAADWVRSSLGSEVASTYEVAQERRRQSHDAARRLLSILRPALDEAIEYLALDHRIGVRVGQLGVSQGGTQNGREYLGPNGWLVTLGRADPGPSVEDWFVVTFDPSEGSRFPLAVIHRQADDDLEVRLTDVDPVITASLRARVQAWSRAALAELARQLLSA